MNRLKSSIAALATVCLLSTGLVLVAPSLGTAAQSEIALPETPTEHAAEAARYEKESLDLEAKAVGHTERAARHKARMKGMSGKQSNAQHGLYKHCERLAKAYRNAAAEAGEMAKMHREMAAQ